MTFCYRRNDSESESNARVLAVAWLTLPWGVIASVGVYKVVMWWQGISISQDYASSMVVLGKVLNHITILGELKKPSYDCGFSLLVNKAAMRSKHRFLS